MSGLAVFGTKVALLLISVVFNFFEFCILMRFLLQLVKADFRNPFCQFLVKITSPLLHPLRRVIPGWFGVDVAALVLFYLALVLELSLSGLVTYHFWSALILLKALLVGVHFYLSLTLGLIVLSALFSWIPNAKYQPMGILLHLLTDPYLRAIRRILPTLGGFDLSPLVAIIAIQILLIGLESL